MKRNLLITGIVIGAILAMAPIWGMAVVAFCMNSAMDVLGQSGISDPGALSSRIGTIFIVQTLGLIACPVGLAVCIFSVFKLQAIGRRPPPLPPNASRSAPDFKA
jgi:hypothetical protein